MRLTTLLATTLALTAAACATGGKTADAPADDFARDLRLASATSMDLAAPAVNMALLTSLETAPEAEPEPVRRIERGDGDRAIESEAPTVEATPEPEPVAAEEAEPVATTVAAAPAPVESNEPVAVAPRAPAPVIPASGAGAGDYGRGGGVFGGGVVIRGGGVHGDNCELHARGRGVIISASPVYVPRSLPATGSVNRPMTAGSRILRLP